MLYHMCNSLRDKRGRRDLISLKILPIFFLIPQNPHLSMIPLITQGQEYVLFKFGIHDCAALFRFFEVE